MGRGRVDQGPAVACEEGRVMAHSRVRAEVAARASAGASGTMGA